MISANAGIVEMKGSKGWIMAEFQTVIACMLNERIAEKEEILSAVNDTFEDFDNGKTKEDKDLTQEMKEKMKEDKAVEILGVLLKLLKDNV